MMIHWQAFPQRLLTVHTGNNNQSFCHRFSAKVAVLKGTALPWCPKHWVYEGLILSGMPLRSQEIDKHLRMTPINHKDKSSVSCAILRETGILLACKHCPQFVRDTITALADPICITVWTTNVIDHNIDYGILEKRVVPREQSNIQIRRFIFFDLSWEI